MRTGMRAAAIVMIEAALLAVGGGAAAALQDEDGGSTSGAADGDASVERPATGVGLDPGGGGLFVRGEDFEVRLLGYIQPTGMLFPRSLERPDAPGAFSIRRARLDLLVELQEDYTLFVELDGAPTDRTALVEAWLNWRVRGDGLQVRAGKFIGRFSAENTLSSRDLDTVERFMALNSMFLLPALDTQTGAMVHGTGLAGGRLGYSLGVYNGNGSANENRSEDNAAKEVQARVDAGLRSDLSMGLALDWTREEAQTLRLLDLGFNTYASVPVEGRRYGVGGNLAWTRGETSLRAEGLAFRFEAPPPSPDPSDAESGSDRVTLHGGFLQGGRFVRGGPGRGIQLVARAEWARLGAPANPDTNTLAGLTAGVNAFPHPNGRLQLNAVLTRSTGPSAHQGFESARWMPMLLGQLQFKL